MQLQKYGYSHIPYNVPKHRQNSRFKLEYGEAEDFTFRKYNPESRRTKSVYIIYISSPKVKVMRGNILYSSIRNIHL